MSKTASSSQPQPLYAVVRVDGETPEVVADSIERRESAFREAEARSDQLPPARYCVKTHTALVRSIGGNLPARWGR